MEDDATLNLPLSVEACLNIYLLNRLELRHQQKPNCLALGFEDEEYMQDACDSLSRFAETSIKSLRHQQHYYLKLKELLLQKYPNYNILNIARAAYVFEITDVENRGYEVWLKVIDNQGLVVVKTIPMAFKVASELLVNAYVKSIREGKQVKAPITYPTQINEAMISLDFQALYNELNKEAED